MENNGIPSMLEIAMRRFVVDADGNVSLRAGLSRKEIGSMMSLGVIKQRGCSGNCAQDYEPTELALRAMGGGGPGIPV